MLIITNKKNENHSHKYWTLSLSAHFKYDIALSQYVFTMYGVIAAAAHILVNPKTSLSDLWLVMNRYHSALMNRL